jgi:hypothetical protein
VTVGSATAAQVSITGQTMEPRYPYLAGALATGDIPMDAAARHHLEPGFRPVRFARIMTVTSSSLKQRWPNSPFSSRLT